LKCERLRIGTSPDYPIQVERIVGDNDVTQPSIFDESEEPGPGHFEQKISLSMQALLSRVKTFAELNPTISTPTLILIFDQFEELFTRFEFAKINSGPDKKPWQRHLTDTIVTLALEGSRHLRLLLVIREDFLADLEVMARDYPRVMDYRVRLNYLTGREAMSAILDPLVDRAKKTNRFPCVIDPALAEAIVKDIARAQDSSPAGEKDLINRISEHQASVDDTGLTEEAVIPPTQVQIVCSELWDSYADKMHSIGIDEYKEKGGLQGILDSWFESQLQKLDKVDPLLRRPAIIILQNLVTDLGTRDVVSEKRLKDLVLPRAVVEADFSAALNSLADDLHLVETSSQRGTHFYEVASEYLIASIQNKSNDLERKEAAAKAAMAAKEAAEKQAREAKEAAETAARESREAAERSAREVKEAADKAARDLEVSHLQEIATIAKANAETQQKLAEEQARLAEEQRDRAEEKAATARKMSWLVLLLVVACVASTILAYLYAHSLRLAQTGALALEARAHESDDPGLSVRLALKSVYVMWNKGDQPLPLSEAALESSLAKTRVLPASTGPVKAISISGDLRRVAVVDEFGNIAVNEAAKQSNIYSTVPVPADPQKPIYGCQLQTPVPAVSLTTASRQITLLEATWLQPLAAFYAAHVALGPIPVSAADGKHTFAGPKPVFSYDGQYLAFTQSGHERDVLLWKMQSAQKADSLNCTEDLIRGDTEVLSLAFSSPSGLLAVGGSDGTVKLWKIRTSQSPDQRGALDTGKDAVIALALSPDAKRLAIATTDGARGTVTLWDVDKKTKIGVLEGLNATVSAMAFNHNGLLATAENSPYYGAAPPTIDEKPKEEKSVKVWQADQLKLRNTLLLSPGIFKTVSFSLNGKMLAAASQNGAASFVKVWNIETTDPGGVHPDNPVYSGAALMEAISGVALTEDGYQLLTSADSGTLTRHFLLLKDQIKQATQGLRELTPNECKVYIADVLNDADCNDFYHDKRFNPNL
jgi:WD40 repeat protein